MRILFVCTGNTCRSPMCEGYFRSLCERSLRHDVIVESAGIMADGESFPSYESVAVMKQLGIDISGCRSSRLTADKINSADIIVTMTPEHREKVGDIARSALCKTFSLMDFSSDGPPCVADPFGGGVADYESCFRQMRPALENLFLDMDTVVKNLK